jgi:hypothetical protein
MLALAAIGVAWSDASAAREPRKEPTLDSSRIGTVSDDERRLLRVEWTASRTRDTESKILNEIMERLGRIEVTTRELRAVIEGMPGPARPGMPAQKAPSKAAPVEPTTALAPLTAPAPTPPQISATATAAPEPKVSEAPPGSTSATQATTPAPVGDPPPASARRSESAARPAPPAAVAHPVEDDEHVEPFHAKTPVRLVAAGVLVLLIVYVLARQRETRREEAASAAGAETGSAMRSIRPEAHHFLDTKAGYHEPDTLPPDAMRPSSSVVVGSPATQKILNELGVPELGAVAAPSAQPGDAPGSETPPNERPLSPRSVNDGTVPAGFDATLELAEIMLSMGLSNGATQALIDHIQERPKEALAHWLKLLDIYRKDGHRSDFERAARELQQNFNIKASDWLDSEDKTTSLEDFDRILRHVTSLCQTPNECIAYLTHLLEDNREGMRAGFPQPVAEEMILLIAVMREVARAESVGESAV